ncbi:MAG: hypothetical protein D6812_06855 [Deltaproteobacteria bacterium]|nr:MAG: hypothetical protein D6812_06855 [Deltaproteobacteria bacterium]
MQIPKDELWIYEGIFFVILFTLLFALLAAQTRGNDPPRPVPFGRVDASFSPAARFAIGDERGTLLWAERFRLSLTRWTAEPGGAPSPPHANQQPKSTARSVRRNG